MANLNDENGRLAEADALHDEVRETAACTVCRLEGEPIGLLNKDCAGAGEIKRRRYKCRRCKHTLGVSEFLAVYSGQVPPHHEVGHHDMPSESATISAESQESLRSDEMVPESPVEPSDAPSQASVEMTAAANSKTQEPPNVRLPTFMRSNTAATATCPKDREGSQVSADDYDPEERKAKIEATLDKLGLRGINRKRRRMALEVLMPMGTPHHTKMARVAIKCGKVDPGMAVEAVRSLRIDPRTMHYILLTDEGLELLVAQVDSVAIRTKAIANGLQIGEPKPTVPATRKECDLLLKAIMPAARNAKHANARAYFDHWIRTVKDNLPKHSKVAKAGHSNGTAMDIEEPDLDNCFAQIQMGDYHGQVSEPDGPEDGKESTDAPEASLGSNYSSINDISAWMACRAPEGLEANHSHMGLSHTDPTHTDLETYGHQPYGA